MTQQIHFGPSSSQSSAFNDFKKAFDDSRAKALDSPYSSKNGISEATIYDIFKSTQTAAGLDIKYRANVLEQIKNSGLLRTHRRNWWNERILSSKICIKR